MDKREWPAVFKWQCFSDTKICLNSFTTGNGEFLNAFTAWVLQETGVLKVVHTDHHRVNETTPREMYRIKDDVVSLLANLRIRQ